MPAMCRIAIRSRMKRTNRSAAGVGVPKRETRAMELSGSVGKPSSGVSTLMPGRIVLRASAVTPSPATTAAWRAETAALVHDGVLVAAAILRLFHGEDKDLK